MIRTGLMISNEEKPTNAQESATTKSVKDNDARFGNGVRFEIIDTMPSLNPVVPDLEGRKPGRGNKAAEFGYIGGGKAERALRYAVDQYSETGPETAVWLRVDIKAQRIDRIIKGIQLVIVRAGSH